MTRTVAAALLSLFTVSSAFAQAGSACTTNAVGKDGKPLAGAAKASFMKSAAKMLPSLAMANPSPAPRKRAL
jgi:hypothetical protein